MDGLYATPLERTFLDLAESLPFREAVVPADAALALGASIAAIRDLATGEVCRGWRRVQRVIDFANPLSESPGESLSRVLFEELGLPAPLLQREFRDARGLIGRVDFWWPEQGVIGEFDGRVKYLGRYPGAPEDALWREKVREDRLRAVAPRVARWVWSDLETPERLLGILSAAGLTR
ncbi:MAG TPA: hypothetical protein VIL55_00245 [Naasia sp.]